MIVVKNVCKNYSAVRVLDSINLSIEEGEFVALVGTSGYGKTTFLNMLLGVEQASSGEILIDGKSVAKEPGQDCGIVFQHYSVFPHMKVLDNVVAASGFRRQNITGKLFGRQRVEAVADATKMLERVGLLDVLSCYPYQLSGGMRQRLALAQALIAQPRLLLLDEPFGALDPGIRKDMQNLLISLWKQHNLTVIMVTHSLREAFYLGTRVVVFDKLCNDACEINKVGATVTYDLPSKAST